jgi:hypothetical protein
VSMPEARPWNAILTVMRYDVVMKSDQRYVRLKVSSSSYRSLQELNFRDETSHSAVHTGQASADKHQCTIRDP